MRVDDVAVPHDPGHGMVIVEVSRCGICGTDVAEYRDGPFMIRTSPHALTGQSPPITLGHELSGQIVAAGDGVDLALGTRVTADACWRCNACPACLRGDYHLCRFGGSIGLHSDGAFARYVLLPAYGLVPLPDGVSDDMAALSEPLAVSLHALDRGLIRAAADILVLGFGPIGAGCALVGRALGANVVVADAAPARAAAAARLGFTVVGAGDELPRRFRSLLGRLGADIVLECTGVPELLPTAIGCADRGGRIVLVGLAKTSAAIDPSSLTLYERSLVGSLGYRHDVARVVAMMRDGLFDPTPLIGTTIELDAVPETLERLSRGTIDAIKILVTP